MAIIKHTVFSKRLQAVCFNSIKTQTFSASCASKRILGQPTSFTHPYLMREGGFNSSMVHILA